MSSCRVQGSWSPKFGAGFDETKAMLSCEVLRGRRGNGLDKAEVTKTGETGLHGVHEVSSSAKLEGVDLHLSLFASHNTIFFRQITLVAFWGGGAELKGFKWQEGRTGAGDVLSIG